jgi:phosphatidylglycerol:prolipoprotein diacylglycerol transferase
VRPLLPAFDPTLPLPGGGSIHLAGVLVVLGFAAGMWLAVRKARRDGLDAAVLYGLMPWVALGIVIGGHLGAVLFYEPSAVREDPRVLYQVWRGQSAFGGFLACALIGVAFFRSQNRRRRAAAGASGPPIDGWAYTDCFLYGFTAGWAICRLGCFAAHDHPGLPTRFWLGAYGGCPGGDPSVACHDWGLYEALWSFAAYGAFVALDRKPRFPGFFTAALFVAYAIFRFVADFHRHPAADARYLGWTPAQYGCVLMLSAGLWIAGARRGVAPARDVR